MARACDDLHACIEHCAAPTGAIRAHVRSTLEKLSKAVEVHDGALTTLWQIGQLFDHWFNATLEGAAEREATRLELLKHLA